MDLFLVVKNEYADFTILGIFTDIELAQVREAEVRAASEGHGDSRIVAIKADTEQEITTTSI